MGTLPIKLIGEFIDAAVKDHQRAAELIDAHPDLLNARWIHDETALHFLAIEGFTEGVKFLAEHGADVNSINKFGDSALIDAAVLGHTDIAEVLLRHGADPNAHSDTRDNALHCAVERGMIAWSRCFWPPEPTLDIERTSARRFLMRFLSPDRSATDSSQCLRATA